MSAIPSSTGLADMPGTTLPRAESGSGAPYMNPYLAGVGLGLVLLAAFVIMGRGLGATGAFSSFLAWIVQAVSPEHADAIAPYADYLGEDHPLKAWLVFLVAGAFVGALISGLMAQRVCACVEKGPNISTSGRLLWAYVGGALAGIGAKIGLGCTSGQALTGGALLNAGSWMFMLMVFVGGYAAAWYVRKQWI